MFCLFRSFVLTTRWCGAEDSICKNIRWKSSEHKKQQTERDSFTEATQNGACDGGGVEKKQFTNKEEKWLQTQKAHYKLQIQQKDEFLAN